VAKSSSLLSAHTLQLRPFYSQSSSSSSSAVSEAQCSSTPGLSFVLERASTHRRSHGPSLTFNCCVLARTHTGVVFRFQRGELEEGAQGTTPAPMLELCTRVSGYWMERCPCGPLDSHCDRLGWVGKGEMAGLWDRDCTTLDMYDARKPASEGAV
jgi:hypothetical protein